MGLLAGAAIPRGRVQDYGFLFLVVDPGTLLPGNPFAEQIMIPTRSLTRAALILSAFAALCGPALAAEPWKPDTDIGCQDKVATVDIAECLNARTKVWDARLNQAYKALIGMLQADPASTGQIDRLRAAQRLWLQYRKANCNFYAAEQGTIRQIDAAECMRRMTQDRAIELQQAGPQG